MLPYNTKSGTKPNACFRVARFLALVLVFYFCGQAVEHPFLIVKEEDYAELRARAENSPWKEMKAKAIQYGSIPLGNPAGNGNDRATQIIQRVSCAALAYILDPGKKNTYVQNIKTALGKWDQHYKYVRFSDGGHGNWANVVPTGGAFLNSVLALDIIYNELSETDRDSVETKLQAVASWFKNMARNWPPNQNGVLGVWYLYQGDTTNFRAQIKAYKDTILDQLTDDGIFYGGPFYAAARYGGHGNRDAKAHLMDIAEYTGTGSFYSDSVFIGFYEWMYGYSNTPFGTHVTFADTPLMKSFPYSGIHRDATGMCRAHRFSSLAAEYAAFRNKGAPFPGELLPYVLLDKPLPKPKKPVSRVWWHGYAGFLEKDFHDKSLMGVLWCPTRGIGHAHKEANAVYACAYGEPVLINSAYGGFNDILGFNRDYFANRAESGNTLIVEYLDHETHYGGGIAEALTSGIVDYASGDAGKATSKVGFHYRNFCMVHPQDGKPGYFVLFDEVFAKNPGVRIRMPLHPNSDQITEVVKGQEYSAKVTPRRFSSNTVHLNIFMGSQPFVVQIKPGPIGAYDGQAFMAKYLYPTFFADATGRRNLVTVLAPSDPTHPKPDMFREKGATYAGIRLEHGSGIEDYALESDGATEVVHESVRFTGKACLYRKAPNGIRMFFLRQGKRFETSPGVPLGLVSNRNVSVVLRDGVGSIFSTGAVVTFRHKDVSDVYLNWEKAQVVDKGQDWMQVNVPAGAYNLVLADPQTGICRVSANRRNPGFLSMPVRYGSRWRFRAAFPQSGSFALRIFDLSGRLLWEDTGYGRAGEQRAFVWDPGATRMARNLHAILHLSQEGHSTGRKMLLHP